MKEGKLLRLLIKLTVMKMPVETKNYLKDDVAEISYRVTSGVGIPTFSRYTDRLGKLAGILLL